MTERSVERFWAKVQKSAGCWLWTASKNTHGYGQHAVGGHLLRAHRVAYELTVGAIPDGLTLDHLCRVRACVNPAHLEPVSMGENVRRGIGPTAKNATATHCPSGHHYDATNTYRDPRGSRRCRLCANEAVRRYSKRMRSTPSGAA